jgi:hypothetical protein
MAKKTICSIPLEWDLAEYSLHTCHDGSHQHLSLSQVYAHEQTNEIEIVWLRRSESRREKSVVHIQVAKRHSNGPTSPPRNLNSGLSFRAGEYLAMRVRQRKPWAQIMLSQITMRPIAESFEVQTSN